MCIWLKEMWRCCMQEALDRQALINCVVLICTSAMDFIDYVVMFQASFLQMECWHCCAVQVCAGQKLVKESSPCRNTLALEQAQPKKLWMPHSNHRDHHWGTLVVVHSHNPTPLPLSHLWVHILAILLPSCMNQGAAKFNIYENLEVNWFQVFLKILSYCNIDVSHLVHIFVSGGIRWGWSSQRSKGL